MDKNTYLNLIKQFEGFRSKAYKCPANVWTIGWGSTRYKDGKPVTEGDTITQNEADELLEYTIEKTYGKAVDTFVTANINPNQRGALISFAYNCGTGSLKSSTLLKKVNKNPSDTTIRNEFMKWDKSKGKSLPGLTRRRKAEADLYFTSWNDEPINGQINDDKQELTFRGHLETK